jgi:dihydrolipoamide dehydrogenase
VSTRHVDVAIIGAGTAGLTARKQVAKKTKNYVVIDDGILGTTCARVGCMPSKVLIQVANDFHRRKIFESVGIGGSANLSIDHKQVMEHVRKLRDRFVRGVMSSFESWKQEHFIARRARFISQTTLDLGDKTIEAKKIIVATGSSPIIPGPWKEYQKYFVDTDQFFEMNDLPSKIAVVGLGVIGIELGQALHRLGVDVIGIGRGKSIGGLSDPDLVDYVASKFSQEMNIDFNGVESMSEDNGKLVVKTEQDTYKVDKALISVGRKPNIADLGLKEIGLSLKPNGIPHFHPNTYQIEGTPIFIAGDVNAERPLLHESSDEGAVAGFNAVSSEPVPYKRRVFLGITFSSPNIATIGMNHKAIKDKSIDFEVGEVSFEGQGRSIVMLAEKGLLKVYGCKKTSKILGAELFGPSGEHIAHLLAWVISKEMTVQEVLSLPFYHPVVEEGLRTALRDLAGKLIETRPPIELAVCVDHPTNTSKCT